MIKAKDVVTTHVTDEQIGRCHKVFSGSTPFYLVESESDPLVEYRVSYDRLGFHCTCPSGQYGWANAKQTCKHVRWSLAAAAEERLAVAELNRAIAEQAAPTTYTNVDAEALKRIEAANERAAAKPTSRCKAPVSKGFSLLK